MKTLFAIVGSLAIIPAMTFAVNDGVGQRPSSGLLFETGRTTSIYTEEVEKQPVHTAVSLLQKDVRDVFCATLQVSTSPDTVQILAGTMGVNGEIDRLVGSGKIDLSAIVGKWEAFRLVTVTDSGKTILVIAGSDSRGTVSELLTWHRLDCRDFDNCLICVNGYIPQGQRFTGYEF
jgi:hypothetical protein